MEARPKGITYSRTATTTHMGRPIQVGGAAPATPSPTNGTPSTATATAATTSGVGYLTLSRGLLLLGLLLSIAAPANLGLGAYLFMGMFLVPTLLALVLTVSTGRPWAYVTSLILGLVFPLLFIALFAASEGGFNPVNRAAFTATLLNMCAIPLVLTGGVGGFRDARNKTGVRFGPGFRTAPGVFALCVASLLLGGLVTSYAASESVLAASNSGFDAQPQATTSTLMKDFAFTPKVLTVAVATYTEIVVSNEDATPHTFTYKNAGTEYNHQVVPGQTTSFVVLFAEAGTYRFWCQPHSGGETDTEPDSMVGQIIVA